MPALWYNQHKHEKIEQQNNINSYELLLFLRCHSESSLTKG
jgi:hypothetical protein